MPSLDAFQGPKVYAVQCAGQICVGGFIVIVGLYEGTKWYSELGEV